MSGQREIVERARHGDHDAFGVLVTARVPSLYRVARLICGSDQAAEDATQEAMIAAWRGLPRLREVDSFDAWLRRLLVRSSSRQRRDGRSISFDPEDWPQLAPDDLGQVAERDEIARAFARMTADQRAALVLRYFEDLSLSDVAIALGVPEGTVKSRIHRGLASLRAALEANARIGKPGIEGAPR